MVRVKICGMTNVREARIAADLGADALGFNFFKGSPRYVKPARAKAIIAALPPLVMAVGLFVDAHPDDIMSTVATCGLDAVQLHGDETPRQVDAIRGVRRIKAIRVADARDVARCRRYRAEAYLLDTYVRGEYGGTGKVFDWELAREAGQFGPIILAGGLAPDNVEEAIRIVHPYGVDTASGVETAPGRKDKDMMQEFILRAKGALL